MLVHNQRTEFYCTFYRWNFTRNKEWSIYHWICMWQQLKTTCAHWMWTKKTQWNTHWQGVFMYWI